MEKVKINSLQIENVKRVKAVVLEPAQAGLTVVGGKNEQGKTSVLDAICWALGGNKYKPSAAWHEGSVVPPYINIRLSNGLQVERRGKNSELKVTDPTGRKSGQSLLDSFISQFALDLPRFMEAPDREKASILLNLLGVESELLRLESDESEIYSSRHAIGQIADQKVKHANEMTFYPDAPAEAVSAMELIYAQQDILARNGENERKRRNYGVTEDKIRAAEGGLSQLMREKEEIERKIAQKNSELYELKEDAAAARKTLAQLKDESTAEIERKLNEIDAINKRVAANIEKAKADDEAREYSKKYDELSRELEKVRRAKKELLTKAALPLPELSIMDGELAYKGKKWDCMSGSERLRVAVAVTSKLQPGCGFVLMDKLEQLDTDQLSALGEYLKEQGLQVIATRVGTGDECTIVIEDGIGGASDAIAGLSEYKVAPENSGGADGVKA